MKRIIKSNTDSHWWTHFYDEVSVEELAQALGCDVSNIDSVEDLDDYEATHVSWLIAKDEFYELLSNDSYEILEVASEGDEPFLAFQAGSRLYDVTNEVKSVLDNYQMDSDENFEDYEDEEG